MKDEITPPLLTFAAFGIAGYMTHSLGGTVGLGSFLAFLLVCGFYMTRPER